MKKIFAFAIALVAMFNVCNANAQNNNYNNIEDYAQAQYGSKWTQAAMRAADETPIDRDGNLSFTKTNEAPGMSQEDLYYEVADYFISNYQNSIQMAEKSDGIIVARPYISDITSSAAGWNEYKFDICPTIRIKVTDGKVKIDYCLKDYGVVENTGGGHASTAVACGLLVGAVIADVTTPTETTTVVEHRHGHHHGHHYVVERTYRHRPHYAIDDALAMCALADLASGSRYDNRHAVWNINNCYPFSSNDHHKKASAKAFVVASTFSQMMMRNIESAINY